ncbi:MAG TPA: thiamine pyrophosphate-binding protein [Streptosporangiaceae bacterium]
MTATLAHQLDPEAVTDELAGCGVTHVVTVPDYVMMSVYRSIEARATPRLVYSSTEDEAIAVTAGLHIGGARPMVMMQNQGLYASLNAIRALAVDARLPVFMLIGQFGREYANLGRPARQSARPLVRNCERILDALDIPYARCEAAGDVSKIAAAYRLAHQREGAAAALVGTYTAWPGFRPAAGEVPA